MGENDAFPFVEFNNGMPIDGHRLTQLRASSRAIWTYILSRNLAPETWGKASLPVQNYYRLEMYKQYPELRLCENHWKVDYIATKSYPGWYRTYGNIDTLELNQEDCDAYSTTPINIPQKRPAPLIPSHKPNKAKVPRTLMHRVWCSSLI
jgi:hypothetical protein